MTGLLESSASAPTPVRKLRITVAGRLGCVILPDPGEQALAWRYQRAGGRVLGSTTALTEAETVAPVVEGEHEADLDERVEAVVELLLDACRGDLDSVVRWAGAKAIGRVCNRLPTKALCDEVVTSLIAECFDAPSPSAWHGGCLAMAELTRRGLLLESRLDQVLGYVVKALEGQLDRQLRDSACYVCWALARAYPPKILKHIVPKVVGALVSTACFDREVNCRRAASAALQELVGRSQGGFEHGIDIITAADYFTVSNRDHSSTAIALSIARLDRQYLVELISHLVRLKLPHPDRAMRALAAKALAELALVEPLEGTAAHLSDEVLPEVITTCTAAEGVDTTRRHGCLLALASLTASVGRLLGPQAAVAVRNVIPLIEKHRLFRGRGSELTRSACCQLLAEIAQCTEWEFKLGLTAPKYQQTVDECLRNTVAAVQIAAADALYSLCTHRWPKEDPSFSKGVVDKYVDKLNDPNENVAARRGYLLGLSSLSEPMYANEQGARVLEVLIREAKAWPDHPLGVDVLDPESRMWAVVGLCRIMCVCGFSRSAFEAVVLAAGDYATDRRGDVGSWVRETALQALGVLMDRGIVQTEADATAACRVLLTQAAEKIDRTRALACMKLHSLTAGALTGHVVTCDRSLYLDVCTRIYDFAAVDSLKIKPGVRYAPTGELKVLPEKWPEVKAQFSLGPTVHAELSTVQTIWSSDPRCYLRTARLLKLDEYRSAVLQGLVVSIGSATEHVSSYARKALLSEAKANPELQPLISSELLDLLKASTTQAVGTRACSRLTVPVLVTVIALLKHRLFDQTQFPELFRLVTTRSSQKTRDIYRLKSGVEVMCGVLANSNQTVVPKVDVLRSVLAVMGHPIPRVRHFAVTALYMTIMEADDLGIGSTDTAVELLMSTEWTSETRSSWESALKELYEVFNLEMPVLETGEVVRKGQVKGSAVEYSDFVKEEHWM